MNTKPFNKQNETKKNNSLKQTTQITKKSENLIKLVKQSIKISQENKKLIEQDHKMIKKIKRYVVFSQITGFIKLIIILIPIILGFIYIPPIISSIMEKYQQIFEILSSPNPLDILKNIFGSATAPNNPESNDVISQILNIFK